MRNLNMFHYINDGIMKSYKSLEDTQLNSACAELSKCVYHLLIQECPDKYYILEALSKSLKIKIPKTCSAKDKKILEKIFLYYSTANHLDTSFLAIKNCIYAICELDNTKYQKCILEAREIIKNETYD